MKTILDWIILSKISDKRFFVIPGKEPAAEKFIFDNEKLPYFIDKEMGYEIFNSGLIKFLSISFGFEISLDKALIDDPLIDIDIFKKKLNCISLAYKKGLSDFYMNSEKIKEQFSIVFDLILFNNSSFLADISWTFADILSINAEKIQKHMLAYPLESIMRNKSCDYRDIHLRNIDVRLFEVSFCYNSRTKSIKN